MDDRNVSVRAERATKNDGNLMKYGQERRGRDSGLNTSERPLWLTLLST